MVAETETGNKLGNLKGKHSRFCIQIFSRFCIFKFCFTCFCDLQKMHTIK